MHDSVLDPTPAPDVAAEVFVTPRTTSTTPRVAVVDDSREMLDLIADVLGPGYEVATFPVVRTIEQLAATDPAILIIDLHCGGPLGGLTGWEILDRARSHPSLGRVPAVVISADLAALRQDRLRLVAYGDVQLVAKPFDVVAFRQTVERMLRLGTSPRGATAEDAAYPPLADLGDAWREGRPLAMCPHGRVREQGERCPICG